tara:strand:+ start:285 stop:449 length:165 start_codon:yes stop_codon:yes gene_type:complete
MPHRIKPFGQVGAHRCCLAFIVQNQAVSDDGVPSLVAAGTAKDEVDRREKVRPA